MRTNVRRAAVVLAAVSALALTACEPSGSSADKPSGTGKATATPPTAKPSTGGTATAKPSPAKPSPAKPSDSTGGDSSPDPEYDLFPCSTYDATFSASLAESTTSSYLLKITNKSGKPCKALTSPIVTFGELDGQANERKETLPGKDLVLKPGESAYAGLMGGKNDGKGKTVNYIRMTMNTESDLEQKPLKASTPGLYVAPTNSVTAWMNNAEDALSL
ncbi:DUF4232 domain-containing protein [Streptomyces sp. NPDC005408]|uniref:DUF4232 domain-containing protein n=1 Tax=Streptomyces sp. NPDC005408 TaxID=3155341 RepID=UPI0033A812A7